MQRFITFIAVCTLIMVWSGITAMAGVISPDLEQQLQLLKPGEELPVIVTLSDKVDIQKFKDKDKSLRRSKMLKALKDKSKKTQTIYTDFLEQKKAQKVRKFWIINGFAFTATGDVIRQLAAMDGVESIEPDIKLNLMPPVAPASTGPPEWNISAVKAPEVWAEGYDGTGVVLANMDSGVDYTHPDLSSRWRGGTNSWYDPYGEHAAPHDVEGHGTEVMGIMVGGDAGTTSIGVAPGAQWIAVKIFNDSGSATSSAITSGFQWLLDPDDNPDTDDAPAVVNNSWSYDQATQLCLTFFQSIIQTLKAAEIGVVFASGNNFYDVSPGNYPETFSVGAVDSSLNITSFSGRGPSTCYDGNTFPYFYPDIVAPGQNVWTADLGGGYRSDSGTSFSAPHVAAAMGLLLGADPTFTVSQVEAALRSSAVDKGSPGPDNTYGYGLIDLQAAADLLGITNQAPVANSDIATVERAGSSIIAILTNDNDPDGTLDPATVVLRGNAGQSTTVTTGQGATVEAAANGTVTYTPAGGGGVDYFWYTVDDNQGKTSNEARVRINRVRNLSITPNSLGRTK